MHIPTMITDLAVMLLTAGVITIIFKKIKQPLILGYILAGFLISPYFPLFFNAGDMDSIDLWSEIGVIILMFYIGLEFDLHKLARMGGTAIISAVVKMSGVMLTGYLLGMAMGFSSINCIFLGGMLSISSTAVIQKSFEELGLKNEKYAQLVMGTLVIEDIVGIFMMVVLSTISVSQTAAGSDLVINLFLMVCYLVVWLLAGVFLLPSLLNRVIHLMNDEMLLILSLGLCFGMVLIADFLGFSPELGAFLSGSLLAGTVHVERIEKITKGVKDMFVSIFFLSVGMMVNPQAIADYAAVILIITLTAIAAKLIFATAGMLLSGQSLNTAVKSGFSLAPIGEFSFIIASLGVSLGVMESHLYPIIVSAAVITTFITPFLIKRSGAVVAMISAKLPDRLLTKLNRYTDEDQIDDDKDNDWNAYIRRYFSRLVLYGVIMLTAAMAGIRGAAPLLCKVLPETPAKIIACLMIYLVMAIFTRPMLNFHSSLFTSLWLKRRANRLPLIVLATLKVLVIALIAAFPLSSMFGIYPGYLIAATALAVLITAKSGFMSTSYLQLETRFLRNLNERIIARERSGGQNQSWLDEQLYIISLIVPKGADFIGKSLLTLQWGRVFNVHVVKIRRHDKQYILPNQKSTIHAGDKIYVVGDLKSIENFYRLIRIEPSKPPRTLKQFMDTGYPDVEHALAFCPVKLTGGETFAGRSLKNGRFKEKWHCMVLGLQQKGYPIVMPDPNTLLKKGDIIWIMGSNNHVGRLAAECACELLDPSAICQNEAKHPAGH